MAILAVFWPNIGIMGHWPWGRGLFCHRKTVNLRVFLVKRVKIDTVLPPCCTYFRKNHEIDCFLPELSQMAVKWPGTWGHFNVLLKESQYFPGRQQHFPQKLYFMFCLVLLIKTGKMPSHPVLNTVNNDLTDTVLSLSQGPFKSGRGFRTISGFMQFYGQKWQNSDKYMPVCHRVWHSFDRLLTVLWHF